MSEHVSACGWVRVCVGEGCEAATGQLMEVQAGSAGSAGSVARASGEGESISFFRTLRSRLQTSLEAPIDTVKPEKGISSNLKVSFNNSHSAKCDMSKCFSNPLKQIKRYRKFEQQQKKKISRDIFKILPCDLFL